MSQHAQTRGSGWGIGPVALCWILFLPWFNNYDSQKPIVVAGGSLAPVAATFVEIWAGPIGQPLRPIADVSGRTQFSLSEPGFFDAGFGIVPDLEMKSQVQIQGRAWREGTSFQTARFRGSSPIFTQGTGSAFPPPNPPTPAVLKFPQAIVLEPVASIQSGALPLTGADHANSGTPQITALTQFSTRECQLTIVGQAGGSIVLQASAELINWDLLGVFPNPTGTLRLLDPSPVAGQHRFYRVLSPQ